MERRRRAVRSDDEGSVMISSAHFVGPGGPMPGACAVCSMRDARLLVMVELHGGAAVTLCGSHALMQSRFAPKSRTVTELRATLCDRRGMERRARATDLGDELAEQLTAAFTRERRSSGERRAS